MAFLSVHADTSIRSWFNFNLEIIRILKRGLRIGFPTLLPSLTSYRSFPINPALHSSYHVKISTIVDTSLA